MGNEKLRAAVARRACSSQNVTHQLRTTVQSSRREAHFQFQKKEPLLFFLAATTATSPAQPERAPLPPQLHKHIGRAGLHPHVCFFPPCAGARALREGLKKQGLSEDCDQGHLLALLKGIVMFDQNDFAHHQQKLYLYMESRKVVIFKRLPHPHRIGPAPKHDARRTCGRGRQARDVRDASQAGRARPAPFYNRTSCHLDKA